MSTCYHLLLRLSHLFVNYHYLLSFISFFITPHCYLSFLLAIIYFLLYHTPCYSSFPISIIHPLVYHASSLSITPYHSSFLLAIIYLHLVYHILLFMHPFVFFPGRCCPYWWPWWCCLPAPRPGISLMMMMTSEYPLIGVAIQLC